MREPRADVVRVALAAVTAWLDDEDLGRALAADQHDHDPIGFLDALGGLWSVVGDVAQELDVDVAAAIPDIALGSPSPRPRRRTTLISLPDRPHRRSLTRGEEEKDRERRVAQGHRGQIRTPSRRAEGRPARPPRVHVGEAAST